MPSSHLILCHPLLLLPSISPSIRVFSNESALCIRWPKYWSFSISPSSEYSGLTSFRIDWLNLLAVQGTLKSLLQHQSISNFVSGTLAASSRTPSASRALRATQVPAPDPHVCAFVPTPQGSFICALLMCPTGILRAEEGALATAERAWMGQRPLWPQGVTSCSLFLLFSYLLCDPRQVTWASLVAQMVKIPPTMRETCV